MLEHAYDRRATTGGGAPAAGQQSPASPTRIALVDDHVLFAEVLALAMQSLGYDAERLDLPERTRTVETLLGAIVQARPDVVLLDLDLGVHGNGVRLIEPLVRAGIKVLVVTGDGDRVRWGECLSLGASLVTSKNTSLDSILRTVARLVGGLRVIDLAERAQLLQLHRDHREHVHVLRQRLEALTRREQEVLGHLTSGRQVRDIAAISVVSEATVRTQVKSILAKLQVSSQLAAVGVAREADWHYWDSARAS